MKPSNPGTPVSQGNKDSPGEAYLNRNVGPAIASPKFSIYNPSPDLSFLAAILSTVDSLIKAKAGVSWSLPEALLTAFAAATAAEGWSGIRWVVVYLRVSTEDQRESRDSLQDQLRDALELCVKYGLVPMAIFWEDHTGTVYKRPALEQVFDLVQRTQGTAMPVKGVLVWKMNRYGRESVRGIGKLQDLNALGACLLYRRRATGRLRCANLADPEERDDAWEALREAEDQHAELHENTARGQQGDVNRGRTYGVRTWFLYETSEVTPDGAPVSDRTPSRRGRKTQAASETWLVKRPDARDRWEEAYRLLEAQPTWDTIRALAKKYHLKPRELLDQLRDPVVMGYYTWGKFTSDRPIDRLILFDSVDEAELKYEAMGRLLRQVEAAPRKKRAPKVVAMVQETSMAFVYIQSGGDIAPRCHVREGGKAGPRCNKPTEFRNTNKEENHRGLDQYVCPDGHVNTVPSDRVLNAFKDGVPAPCRVCHRNEFLAPSKRVCLQGNWYVETRCGLCNSRNLADAETDPARQATMRRRALKGGREISVDETYKLNRQRQATITPLPLGGPTERLRGRDKAKEPKGLGERRVIRARGSATLRGSPRTIPTLFEPRWGGGGRAPDSFRQNDKA